MKQRAVILNVEDNVATALVDLKSKDGLELKFAGGTITIELNSDIPFGHKFSIANIEHGSQVIKYGEAIGIAKVKIHPGDYVHVHNVESARGRGDLYGGTK